MFEESIIQTLMRAFLAGFFMLGRSHSKFGRAARVWNRFDPDEPWHRS